MSTHKFLEKRQRPIVLGHRGVPKLHQENTLSGFRRAVELGIDGVEFDVFRTADDKLAVFHDEQTERLTGVKGEITEMTWDEVSKLRIARRIDMGHGQVIEYEREERIPLLEEVLQEFNNRLLMNVEMKAYKPNWFRRHTGMEVARTIRDTKSEQAVVVTSFDFFMLRYLERENPGLESGFAYDDSMFGNFGDWFKWVPEIRSEISKAPGNQNSQTILNFFLESDKISRVIGSTLVDVDYSLFDSDTVSKFHQNGKLVGSYTLYPLDTRRIEDPSGNQQEVLNRLLEYQVDWIETDDPEKLMNTLTNRLA